MRKFKTGFGIEIKEVEIVRETAKQVVVLLDGFRRQGERREAKRSSYNNYFDTWKEAKEYLLNKVRRRIEGTEAKLKREKKRLAEIELIKA